MEKNPEPGQSPSAETISVPNSKAQVEETVAAGKIPWSHPLILVVARSVFMIAAQGLVATTYLLRHHPTPWRAAAPWWTVYATLVDAGCLALMARCTRAEGIRLRDLIGRPHLRWGQDIFLGIGYLAIIFPFFWLAAPWASRMAYGTPQPEMYPGLLTARALPLWGVIYSLSVFWIIWSPTEEMTYNGYALPRLYALSGRWWVAVCIVSFWWTLQHSFIPFIVDWRYVVWRFLAFLPGVIVMTLLYLLKRRLPPLILAHWMMDILGVFITLKF